MSEGRQSGKSGLLMLELLIAVGVFAFCAAVCVSLFARADTISRESAALDRAVAEAQNVAELFKFTGGDVEDTAALAGGWTQVTALVTAYGEDGQPVSETPVEIPCVVVAYDEDWKPLPFREKWREEAAYALELSVSNAEQGYAEAALTLWNQAGEPILSWPVAALEVAS